MASIFIPEVSIAEKILRSIAVYVFILLAFRFTGKRQVGQLTPFDLVVLLLISNVVQNAVIGPDNSLGGGLIGAVVVLALNYAFVEATYRWPWARRWLEARPTLLVHNGRVLQDALRRERVTIEDLRAALRKNGLVEPDEARFAVLEENGGISIVPFGPGARPVNDSGAAVDQGVPE